MEPNWTQISWRKSRASGLNGCVEIGLDDERVYVRDSTDPDTNCVMIKGEQWIHFVEQVKRGVFDLLAPEHMWWKCRLRGVAPPPELCCVSLFL